MSRTPPCTRWRADDLLHFAERRATPTILVGGDELCSGLDALRNVSRLNIVVTMSEAHANTDIVIRERHRSTGTWKAPLACSTPIPPAAGLGRQGLTRTARRLVTTSRAARPTL